MVYQVCNKERELYENRRMEGIFGESKQIPIPTYIHDFPSNFTYTYTPESIFTFVLIYINTFSHKCVHPFLYIHTYEHILAY